MTDTSANQSTITEIVSLSGTGFDNNDQDFDMLLAALQAADLANALNDPAADLSVFAPTDEAFVKLAQDFGYRGIDEAEAFDTIVNTLTVLGGGDPIPLLTDILLYHVSPGAKTQADIRSEGIVETLLTDATFTVAGRQLIDGEPDLIDPRFESSLSDIQAQNGIIQGINRVLIPIDVAGNDTTFIVGTNDEDFLDGRAGSSILLGGRDEDILLGSRENDQLIGGGDDDVLRSLGGNDIFRGQGGDDVIISGPGDNLIDGGPGRDRIFLNGGADTVVLAAGDDADIVNNFSLGSTTFSLAGGLTFEDLTFRQGNRFSVVAAGTDVLARVTGVSARALNDAANFA